MAKEIENSKLRRYFEITRKALEKAGKAISKKHEKSALQILDMASRYYKDAQWFENRGDFVNAFAAINYAHGWLDAGSRLGIFKVKDSKLFVIK
jgi:hypothetical protein